MDFGQADKYGLRLGRLLQGADASLPANSWCQRSITSRIDQDSASSGFVLTL